MTRASDRHARRPIRFRAALVAASLALLSPAPADARGGFGLGGGTRAPKPPPAAPPADEPCEPVVVTLRDPSGGLAALSPAAKRARIRSLQDDALATAELVDLHRYTGLAALAGCATPGERDALLASPYVASVADDLLLDRSLEQTVPLIGADVVQSLGVTGGGVTVAVIDAGVDAEHPDLERSVVAEQCFCRGCCPDGSSAQSGAGSALDEDGHGTHVAGIVASDGFFAPVGVAPDASIVAVKVASVDDEGNEEEGYASDLIAALDWVVEERFDVDVVNLSVGTKTRYPGVCDSEHPEIELMAQAIGQLVDRGVVVFASSGNDHDKENMDAPACIGDVISVSSVYHWDYPVGKANGSPELDLFAPGSNVESSEAGGYSSVRSGTSMASPHAAATAALVLQAAEVAGAERPTPEAIRTLLKQTGVPLEDPANGQTTPRVDALAAVSSFPIAPWVEEISLEPADQANGAVVCGAVGAVRVRFGKRVVAASFGLDDLDVVLPEDAAPGLLQGVEPVVSSCVSDLESQTLLCSEFEIALDPLSSSFPLDWGSYAIRIGTDISDFYGQPLDNDRDGLPAEAEDEVLVLFSVQPDGPLCDGISIDDLLRDVLEPDLVETLYDAEFEIWDLQIPIPTDPPIDVGTPPFDPSATAATHPVATGGALGAAAGLPR